MSNLFLFYIYIYMYIYIYKISNFTFYKQNNTKNYYALIIF